MGDQVVEGTKCGVYRCLDTMFGCLGYTDVNALPPCLCFYLSVITCLFGFAITLLPLVYVCCDTMIDVCQGLGWNVMMFT